MTHNMHPTFVVSGVAAAGAVLSAAIVAGRPATAADSWSSTTAQMQQLISSRWAKFCGKGSQPDAKEVCFTSKDTRTSAGEPVVAAALIEPAGEARNLFRVTLPSPLQVQYGTRIMIDKEWAISGAFLTCFANGSWLTMKLGPNWSASSRQARR
jgi:invasion protein IalB